MIELKDVSKFYNANGVTNVGIQNVNLTLKKGEIIAITGESGSGKSTLLNVLTKIDTFDEGEIYYKGNPTSYFNISDMDDFRKNKVGFIFQNYNILDSYTVLDNVKLPLLLKGMSDSEAENQAKKLLEKVKLDSKIKSRGSKLSGGEKQRCVIARALASDCEILACDEPTGNLDSKTAKEIIDLIKEVATDKLVLIVTHNYSEVEDIVTRRLKVSDGRIVEDIEIRQFCDIDDDNEDLNLDYKPIEKKICAKIALSNIRFTPKKTILVSIIFFVISFVTFAILEIVNSGITNSLYFNEFPICFENYMSVYNEDASKVDLSLISDYEYEVNTFAYEKRIVFDIGDRNGKVDLSYKDTFYLCNMVEDYELYDGHLPENENEVIIVVPDSYGSYKWYTNYIGYKINNADVKGESDFVISGVCLYNDRYCTTPFVTGSEKFAKYCNNSAVNYELKLKYENIETVVGLAFDLNKKTALYLDSEYKNEDIQIVNCIIEDIYEMDVSKIEVIYEDNLAEGCIFVINPLDDLEIDPYYVSLNINPTFVKKIRRQIEKEGLKVNYPFEDGENDLDKLLGKILAFVVNLELSIYLIGIFFITYLIISKVFASRIKDYEILRTLGITKKDMKRIVNYEVLSIGIGMMVIAMAIGYVLIYTVKALKLLRVFSFITLILYLFVISLFVWLMAKRFNKKLFKFSVRKSFEGEEDD